MTRVADSLENRCRDLIRASPNESENGTPAASVERELALAYRRQFLGQAMEGLVEGGAAPGADGPIRKAMTDRYLTVRFGCRPGGDSLTGRVVRLRIRAAGRHGLRGELERVLPV